MSYLPSTLLTFSYNLFITILITLTTPDITSIALPIQVLLILTLPLVLLPLLIQLNTPALLRSHVNVLSHFQFHLVVIFVIVIFI